MTIPWDAVGVSLTVMGLTAYPLYGWVCRWADHCRIDAEVQDVLEHCDLDDELWWLLVDAGVWFEPLPVSDEELLDVAYVAGVVKGGQR